LNIPSFLLPSLKSTAYKYFPKQTFDSPYNLLNRLHPFVTSYRLLVSINHEIHVSIIHQLSYDFNRENMISSSLPVEPEISAVGAMGSGVLSEKLR